MLKQVLRPIADLFLKRYVRSLINEKLDHEMDSRTAEQLVYDVTRFSVFNQVPGDYLEFGVFEGDTLVRVFHRFLYQWKVYQKHASIYGHSLDSVYFEKKRFFAFDSFQGLPEAEQKKTPEHFSVKNQYEAPLERVRSNLVKKKVNLEQVVFVPGWFDKSLTPETKEKTKLTQAAMVFIDCDLYESAVPIFSFITPLIQDGTVIILDDFFRYKGRSDEGIQKAFWDWLKQHPEIQVAELTRCSANRLAYVCSLRKGS